MPGIGSINNAYGGNTKKVSSKLTFEVGEKFAGKIIGKGEGNEVIIKLTDGWQFSAEIDQDVNIQEGITQFEVAGFKNGKLILTTTNSEDRNVTINMDALDELAKEGVDNEQVNLLKSMIKHNITLTRENIQFVRSLVDFNEKIKQDPKEIDKFINTYLESKEIDPNSQEGMNIKKSLSEFFQQYKSLGKEDILLFIENNIDINKENIESFNKIFKGNQTLTEIFTDIDNEINNKLEQFILNNKDIKGEAFNNNYQALSGKIDFDKNLEQIKNTFISEKTKNNETNNKEVVNSNDKNNISKNVDNKAQNITSNNATKIYDENSVTNSKKASMLSMLKAMTGKEVDIVKTQIKDVLVDNMNKFTNREYSEATKMINNLDAETFIQAYSDSMNKGNEVAKQTINNLLNNLLGKEVNLSNDAFVKISNVIKFVEENKQSKNIEKNDISNNESINNKENNNESISNEKEIINSNKDQVIDSKNQVTDNKVDNTNEKNDNKSIAKENIVKENTTDSKENIVNEKNIDPKENLTSKINDNNKKGEISNKEILSKEEPKVMSDNKTEVKADIEKKLDIMKDVLKDLLTKSPSKESNTSNLINLLKNSANDFKLLNTINNEYYYLDIPIKSQDNEYPCKVIIKDDRKDGKKIDKTNVKMVVTVKTVNLDTVDGFVSLNGCMLNVDLKCYEKYVNVLSKSKDKLINSLSKLGFQVDVNVSEKKEDTNISNCREYFSDSYLSLIDRLV